MLGYKKLMLVHFVLYGCYTCVSSVNVLLINFKLILTPFKERKLNKVCMNIYASPYNDTGQRLIYLKWHQLKTITM